MSIRNRIRDVLDKELFCLPPEDGGECVRSLFVSGAVFDDVRGPFSENFYGRRLGKFRGNLDAFTRGARVSIASDPYAKRPSADFAPVDPVGLDIWDFRSTAPHPQIRCFGAWAEKDVFVGLTWKWRDDISRFSEEAKECREEWDRIFPSHAPYRGTTVDDYIKNRYWAV